MTRKIMDLTNETVNIIEARTCSGKTIKIVIEGEPITQEEALKLWFEILQNLKQ